MSSSRITPCQGRLNRLRAAASRCLWLPAGPAALVELSALALLVLAGSRTAFAQIVDSKLWVTDGVVRSIVPTDDALYIGGDFTRVGPATGAAVVLDNVTGAAQQFYPQVAGWVYAVVPDGAGGWYVGGDFASAQNVTRHNLARFDANGNLLPWNPNANGAVRALLASNGVVYLAGDFSTIGGQSRHFLAAVDPNGGLATVWNPGPNQAVRALAPTGLGTIVVGGDFTLVGATPRSRLAEFTTATGALTAWNPGTNGSVLTLATEGLIGLTNALVYVGGQFTQLGGLARSNLGMVDLNGSVSSWNPGANGTVYSLRVGAGNFLNHTVYAAGDFTVLGGQARNHVGSLSSGSSTATSWNPNANGTVAALRWDGTTVYVGGSFTSIGGQARDHLAAIDAAGSVTGWDPRANGTVWAIELSGARVYIGGALSSVGCVARNHIAMLDLTTGAATAWNPNVNDAVWTMTLRGDTLYFGGRFTSVAATSRNRLASVHAATGALTSWNPNADAPVLAMLDYGGSIRVGGSFNGIGGTFRANIAGLDPITGLATGWEPNALGVVFALALRTRTSAPFTTTIFAGGQFTAIGGASRGLIAELNPATGTATSWNAPAFDSGSDAVDAILPTDTFIYVGGSFHSIGGTVHEGLAVFYGDTGQLSGWDASTAFPCQVSALTRQGSSLYAGGYFFSMGGQPRRGLGEINALSASATSWTADVSDPFLPATVNAMAVRGSTLYVGGQFSSIAGSPHSGLAALTQTPTAVQENISAVAPAMPVRAEPNPSAAGVTLRFALPRAGTSDIAIYNLAGRLVRRVQRGELPAGDQQALWDGRDETGRGVAAGVYVARVRGAGFQSQTKILRLR